MGKQATQAFTSFRAAIEARPRSYEDLDPTPVEIPADKCIPLTLKEEMQRFITVRLSNAAMDDGEESFEDFDDFTIDDEDPDLTSQYTVDFKEEGDSMYLVDTEQTDSVKTMENHPPAEPPLGESEANADNTSPGELTNEAATQ